LTTLLRAIKR